MLNSFDDPGPSLWVALAVALILTALFLRARLNYRAIPTILKLAAGENPPDCMVVIPARNEEASIARAVKSLPHDTVIVVDDHSEDRTAEEARVAGAGVLKAPNLPRGAVGKSNACWAGGRLLTSRWVLFTDADTWFEPGFLECVVGHADANGLAFLSIYLRPECESLAERVLVPLSVALYFCGIGPSNSTGIFNGQCVLVRRAPYEFVGGHLAVLNSVMEDIRLAALAERHRMKFGVVRATQLGHARMQAGLKGVWEGHKRITLRMLISPGSGFAALLSAVTLLGWLSLVVWLFVGGHWVVAIALMLLPCALLAGWYRGPNLLLAPLGMLGMVPIVWNGLIAAFTGRPLEWKGRTI